MKRYPVLDRLKANDSYNFLIKELEKIDEKIQEPLSGTDWPRDMPVITGGGLIESISSIDVTYASTGMEDDNLIDDNTNNIPVIQADFSKQVARTFNFAEYMFISLLEKEKMTEIGRDPETFLNKGIRLHFDKVTDRNVYVGFRKVASTGLCNNPDVTRSSAATGAASSTRWQNKTADEILADINTVLSSIWRNNDCASDALANHILIPVEQYGLLATLKVSEDSERSILTYVTENNICTKQGVEVVISPCKWCRGIGSDGTDRMVAYVNHVDRICMNLTQPLTRMETECSDMRIKIPYIGQFSEVRFLYPTLVQYVDGI